MVSVVGEPSFGSRRRESAVRRGPLVALFVLAAGVLGAGVSGSGVSTTPLPTGAPVLVVSVPGMTWSDLAAADPSAALVPAGAATAVMSVPHREPASAAPWAAALAVNTGWRAVVGAQAVSGAPSAVDEAASGACRPDVVEFARSVVADDHTGARVGALGDAVRGAGGSTLVAGDITAFAALVDGVGCVDTWLAPSADPVVVADRVIAAVAGERSLPSIAWVSFDTLRDVPTDRDDETLNGSRAGSLRTVDTAAAELVAVWRERAPDAIVIVVAPTSPVGAPTVAPLLIATPADDPAVAPAHSGRTGELASATTRRAGYVTLADLAPTLAGLAGAEGSTDLGGTAIGAVLRGDRDDALDDAPDDALDDAPDDAPDDAVRANADRVHRAEVRDASVGAAGVLVVLGVVLAAVTAIARGQRAARRASRWLVPSGGAAACTTFALGWTPYHRLGDSTTAAVAWVALIVAGGAAVLSALVVVASRRWPRWCAGPVWTTAVLLWVLMLVDLLTGSHLQFATPLGYSPTIAGRFQGLGNVAFGLFAASALVGALGRRNSSALLTDLTGSSDGSSDSSSTVAVGAFGVITVVAVAAPDLGSDIGGTLALVPAWVILMLVLSGRRLRPLRVAVAGVVAVLVVAGAAALDLARPAAQRSHLGRFAAQVLDGEAVTVLRRKLAANVELFTLTIWPTVLVVVGVVAVWLARRRGGALLEQVTGTQRERALVLGMVIAASIGFAVNDSGIAVPAAMLVVAVPWLVERLVGQAAEQAGR